MIAADAPRHILVTGASGEIGGALARHYAQPGVHLSLWGRDAQRLTAIDQACQMAGASTQTRAIDLTLLHDTVDAILAEDTGRPVDLAIFASGQGDIRRPDALVEDCEQIARLGAINFMAPASLAAALADRMARRRSGRIVLIGSAAGFHALPFAGAYSASKAGLARFADTLRLAVRDHGVTVTLVSPGFVDTAAARRIPGPKPMRLQPEALAVQIAHAADQGRAHVILPWPFALLRLLDRVLPRALRDRLLLALTPPRH